MHFGIDLFDSETSKVARDWWRGFERFLFLSFSLFFFLSSSEDRLDLYCRSLNLRLYNCFGMRAALTLSLEGERRRTAGGVDYWAKLIAVMYIIINK